MNQETTFRFSGPSYCVENEAETFHYSFNQMLVFHDFVVMVVSVKPVGIQIGN